MTSVGTNRARGNWEQPQNQNQTQHKQRPQATAEQIRLAQMISDHNDADFEEKVKQLIDITGKNQDECVIALHDCNGDVNRAINVLLEGNPDTHSWEMVGKKKGVSGQKDGGQTESNEEGKENRDRDRDYSRRRGGPPRRREVPAVDESFEARKMDWMAPRVEALLLEEAQTEAEGAVAEAEVALVGEAEDFLPKEWEPLTQLIMQSQPILMITMAIVVAIHGTTLATLNQMMEQDLISLGLRGQIIPENLRLLLVHGELQQKSGELKIGMKIFLRPRSLLPLMCLQCLCLRRT
ncbi:ubiquitin-associated protein 2-like isoform X17 [Sigmodon hispidus]